MTDSPREFVAACGGVGHARVLVSRRVAPRLRHRLWTLYIDAFASIEGKAVGTQMLDKPVFDALVDHPDTYKFLGFDEGHLAGTILLTDRLDLVPGVNASFFVDRFPEQAERGAVFYGVFAFVAPGSGRLRLYSALLGAAAQLAASRDGVIVIDMSRHLEEAGQVRLIERSVRGFPGVAVNEIDAQLFYAVTLPTRTDRATGFDPSAVDVVIDLTEPEVEPVIATDVDVDAGTGGSAN